MIRQNCFNLCLRFRWGCNKSNLPGSRQEMVVLNDDGLLLLLPWGAAEQGPQTRCFLRRRVLL